MQQLKDFFLFCSGIDRAVLEKCPTDENKYLGIGATVFFTGVLAFFSAGYALFTVFDSWPAAVGFGLIWGLMIFNLDRYIVSSMKSRGSFFRDLVVALPRLAMAVLLAMVISKPLELKIFEKEIEAELIVMEQEVFKAQEDQVKARYAEQIADYSSQIETLKEENEEKAKLRDELALMALQEADGTGGSMNKNLGPIYRAKKKEADQAQAELDQTLAANLPRIAELEAGLASLEADINTEIATLERGQYGGIAARMDALHRLAQKSPIIEIATLFILFLFIAIETAPIFVKLIAYRSPYDYLLHQHEHVFQMAHKEQTTLLANEVNNKVAYDTDVGLHRVKARIEAERARIDAALQQRVEGLKEERLDWDEVVLAKR